MRTRTLGKSGITVGEIGLGTWSLSGDGYGPVSPGDARDTIEAALDAGVTFIETAACYGGPGGDTEVLVGEVLRSRGREGIFVCTRIGVDRNASDGIVRKRFDREGIEAMAEASRARLGVDRVDAFLLHNPLVETLRDPKGTALEALRALRDTGKAQLIGVSVSNVEAARIALRAGVDLLEVPYSMLYPRVLHALSGDIVLGNAGVIARSPLAYGILADTFAADRRFAEGDHRADRWGPAELARRVRQREAARFLVHDHVRSLREAAIRYVLANHLVHVAVVGARTPQQARENATATDMLPYLPDDDLGLVGGRLRDQGVT